MQEGYTGKPVISLDDLSIVLSVPKDELVYFANNISNHVRQWEKLKKSGKPRTIVAPSKRLTVILQRIKVVFFDDYNYPGYVYGLGKRTLRDHARVHVGNRELIQADLTNFFPSIGHVAVHNMWLEHFSVSTEVARILTQLTTFKGRLQQGFATSSHIASIVALPLTKGLYSHCQANGVTFSQYVDDLNFSGKAIDKRLLFRELITLTRASALAVNKKKTVFRNVDIGKTITGVSVYGQRLRAPKLVRQRAINALNALAKSPKDDKLRKQVSGYQGYLKHLNKVDGQKYKQRAKRI